MNGNMIYPYMQNVIPAATRSAYPYMMRSIPSAAALATRPAGILSTASNALKGFSLTGFLNGASKTLGVVNQAIPIFYQVKPIINNAKTMFRVMKEVNSNDSNETISKKVAKVKEDVVKENTNNPTFFA